MANQNRNTRRAPKQRIFVMLNQKQMTRIQRLMKASYVKQERWQWEVCGPLLIGEPRA